MEWFTYTSWDWFTDGKIKDALSIIANLMWIPNSMYGEWSKLRKFVDIVEAKNTFNNINSTGKINGEKLAQPWSIIWNWVSEKILMEKGFLDFNGWFKVEKSKEELDDKMVA